MPALPTPRFDIFYKHDELTQLLQAYAQALPDLIELRPLGQSHEGRDIWLVVVTRRATGADIDKPAFWVDGNIHAAELTASTACLYWLNHLASGYGTDPKVTQLLDTRVVYIVPRANPHVSAPSADGRSLRLG